jgi:hypothetical protein
MSIMVQHADGTRTLTYADGFTITMGRDGTWRESTQEKKCMESLMKEEQDASSGDESFDEDLEVRRNAL